MHDGDRVSDEKMKDCAWPGARADLQLDLPLGHRRLDRIQCYYRYSTESDLSNSLNENEQNCHRYCAT